MVRLALDFDGVVTNPHKLKAVEFNKSGYFVSAEQTSRDYCTKVLQIPLEEYRKVSGRVNVARLNDVPPEKGALEGLRFLHERNVEIFIVTARMDNEIEGIPIYFLKHNIKIHGILNSNENYKKDLLTKLKPDIFIDDSISHLESLRNDFVANNELAFCKLFLFRNIANRHININEINILRSWCEITSTIVQAQKSMQNSRNVSGYSILGGKLERL